MIERTRMFSDSPLTPGRRAQPPRTIRSIFTPAREASYSALIVDSSVSAFIFAMTRAGLPAAAAAASWPRAFSSSRCSAKGASHRCFRRSTLVRLVRCMKTFSTSLQIAGLVVSMPKSV